MPPTLGLGNAAEAGGADHAANALTVEGQRLVSGPVLGGMGARMQLDSTFVAARIIGPTMIAGGVVLISYSDTTIRAVGDFQTNDGLFVFASLFWTMCGFALITLHRRWDGFTAALVGMLGWLTIAQGLFCLLAPELARSAIHYVLVNNRLVPIIGCVLALTGVWLTYAGYISGIFRVDHSPRLK